MSQVSTPYRFVPLSRLILFPDWAPSVSHDHPFQDGVSGELQVTLTCHTPLCVGGEQVPSSSEAPGKVHVFRQPDGRPAIPGSSLKGMLRNVLDIAAYGRFRQVEDQRLGVRDISSSDNFYTRAMVQSPVQAGWLAFKDGQWQITPCRFSRLHQGQLIKWRGIDEAEWIKRKSAKDRYSSIGLLPAVRFEIEPHARLQQLAMPHPSGSQHGVIVVTGQPGKAFNDGAHSKKYEFVFHAPAVTDTPAAAIMVEEGVMRGFRHIHRDSEEWKFWQEHLTAGRLERGIPVFFHLEGREKVKSLGLAMMYKLPFKHSLHEAIGHTHGAHIKGEAPDLGDLVFGRIDDTHGSLRGRVGIGLAAAAPEPDARTRWLGPTVLANPKPAFYPAYVRQDRGDFRQLMQDDSELSGWKRYPPKPYRVPPPPAKSGSRSQVMLEAVSEGTRFTTRIRLHNLRRVELGALLWTLDFGGKPALRHGLGMGKPFGLGQVSLHLDGWELVPNDPAAPSPLDLAWLHACRQEFVDLMEQTLLAAGALGWASSGPMQALLEFAKPASSEAGLTYLPEPRDFQVLRRKETLADISKLLHAHTGVVPPAGFDTTLPRGWESRFANNLVAERERTRQADLDRAHQQRLAESSPAQRALLEIERLREAFERSTGSKSAADRLNDALRDAFDDRDAFEGEDRVALLGLVAGCARLDNKKIQKACRKFSGTGEGG